MNSKGKVLLGSRWLLIGGAGFIGSHVLRSFLKSGADCYVFDNLITGQRSRIPSEVQFILGEATNSNEILKACEDFEITGIVHLAAFMQARESVANPIKFWSNNLGACLSIASILELTGVKHIILSSSCSVYGNTPGASENSPMNPISPYAMTKVASEQVLAQACEKNSIRLSILRYFNVIGNSNFPESHDHSLETLIPSTVRQVATGSPPSIFGGEFSTPDGSAIRDYLDVRDLASAHETVASSRARDLVEIMNVSSGKPISVKTIVDIILGELGSTLVPQIASAKIGDPSAVWSKPSERLKELGWVPKYTLNESIRAYCHAHTLTQGNEKRDS
jgi:UDP-glucose 4-epimerase